VIGGGPAAPAASRPAVRGWCNRPLEMAMIKEFIKEALRPTGYAIKKLPVDVIEEHLRSLFELLDINCVIDAGAHFGEYGRSLRRNGYRKRIVSFEPVQASFDELRRTIGNDASWHAHKLALGSAMAELEINVSTNSVFSSFLRPTEFSLDNFGEGSGVSATETVQVVTLDSMIAQCVAGISDPRVYLKLDTQGYDLEVLAGARESRRWILGLQSEVSVKQIYVGMPRWMDAIGVFESLGFEVTGLYAVVRDRNMAVVEFDCICTKAAVT
jgi:FkbM family methyltransferase